MPNESNQLPKINLTTESVLVPKINLPQGEVKQQISEPKKVGGKKNIWLGVAGVIVFFLLYNLIS